MGKALKDGLGDKNIQQIQPDAQAEQRDIYTEISHCIGAQGPYDLPHREPRPDEGSASGQSEEFQHTPNNEKSEPQKYADWKSFGGPVGQPDCLPEQRKGAGPEDSSHNPHNAAGGSSGYGGGAGY